MSKIFTVVGARPNFIKIDPYLKQRIIHTGQHSDIKMSRVFFEGLKLPKPSYNLGCTDVGQMIDKLRAIFAKEKPDLVVVIGDTNSTLAGALAASMENIKIAHVEAGLRSGDTSMPEEKNRIVVDKLATIRLCPSKYAAMNLMKEGIKDNVYVVGDPLFDSMGRFAPFKRAKSYGKYILLTMHRNFNVDNIENLSSVLDALGETGEPIIFPVHPRTRKMLRQFKVKVPGNIKLTAPVGYKQMLNLISNAKKVVTDSGGVQREAYWMSVPVIILRDQTEWEEIISKGAGILVGTRKHDIINAVKDFAGKLNAPPLGGVNERIRAILYKFV